MIRIQDAVDGVINAMRMRGRCESSLRRQLWSIPYISVC